MSSNILMDFFTHFLIGIVLGRLIFKDPNKQKAIAFGSILPDLDVFLAWLPYVFPQLYVLSHRGLFHSVLTLLIVFPLAALVVNKLLIFRTLHSFQNDLHFDITKNVYVIGVLGTYLHLLMDLLNPQGVVVFSPLSDIRYTFSTMNFIEPLVSIPSALIILFYIFKKYYKKQSINIKLYDNLSQAVGVTFVIFIVFNTILLTQTIQTQKTTDTVPGFILAYRWVVLDENSTYSVKLVNQFTQQTERLYSFQKLEFNASEINKTVANQILNKAKDTAQYERFKYTLDPNNQIIITIAMCKESNLWIVSFTGIIEKAQNNYYGILDTLFLQNSVNVSVDNS